MWRNWNLHARMWENICVSWQLLSCHLSDAELSRTVFIVHHVVQHGVVGGEHDLGGG